MIAKIVNPSENGRNHGGEKELISTYDAVVVSNGEIKNPVTVRCYMSRSRNASVVYASIWARNSKLWVSGSGSAGGGGYHKASAAIDGAIASAGIELYDGGHRKYIGGYGDRAITEAIKAICKALGYRGKVEIIQN